VRSVYTEAEIADLVISIAAWIAGGRVLHALGLDTVCAAPETVGA
jgi:alkylhydroperoxidase family enzyme